MDCTVHGVAKSRTRLSDFHSLTHTGRQGLKRDWPGDARLWHRHHGYPLLKVRGGSSRLCSQGNLSDHERRPQVSQLLRPALGARSRWPTPALSGPHRNKEKPLQTGAQQQYCYSGTWHQVPALPPPGRVPRPAARLPLSFRQGTGEMAIGASFICCFSILTPRVLVSFPSGRVWKSALFG